jgi:hypothetical protein
MHAIGMFDHQGPLTLEGFEVAVVRDATAAAKVPESDGYRSAVVNFRFLANAVITTTEAAKLMAKADGRKRIAATGDGLRPFGNGSSPRR